ncbi:MAG: endonuclease/exonuclease/phosphatase family protein [Syntrophobacterales bacterium]|nr:endonuclease/exonuclease/phosphatase family protein [Syntrophobacterales bacterium]
MRPRRTLLAAACCLMLCLGGQAAAGETITLFTLNLMGAAGGSRWPERAAALTDYLATRSGLPDLLFFQEGYGGPWSRLLHGGDTLEELARRLRARGHPYKAVSRFCFWETWPFSHYRIGIVSRHPPVAVRERTVSGPGADPRGVAAAVLELPRLGRVVAASVHLSPRGPEAGRLAQLTQVLALLAELAREYGAALRILAGDLNTAPRPDHPLLQELAARGWVDTFAAARPGAPGATFRVPGNPYTRSPGPPVRIDYIFMKGEGVAVEESRVVLDGRDGPCVSDHAGVLTRLRLPAPPPP